MRVSRAYPGTSDTRHFIRHFTRARAARALCMCCEVHTRALSWCESEETQARRAEGDGRDLPSAALLAVHRGAVFTEGLTPLAPRRQAQEQRLP